MQFDRASSAERPASTDEAAFSDSFAVKEFLDTDLSSDAPENGADEKSVDELI
jgi:hypothetical protein